jgi:hypothetical protein
MARETTIFGWPFTADKWAAVFFFSSSFLPVYLLSVAIVYAHLRSPGMERTCYAIR